MLDSLKLVIVNGGELPILPNRFFHYVKKPLSFLAAQTGSAPPGNNIRNYGSAIIDHFLSYRRYRKVKEFYR